MRSLLILSGILSSVASKAGEADADVHPKSLAEEQCYGYKTACLYELKSILQKTEAELDQLKIDLQSFGLQGTRHQIRNVFDHPSNFSCIASFEFLAFVKASSIDSSLLIVRSTGMEDKINLTNAGGNECLKHLSSNLQDLFSAMGNVVAFYFPTIWKCAPKYRADNFIKSLEMLIRL